MGRAEVGLELWAEPGPGGFGSRPETNPGQVLVVVWTGSLLLLIEIYKICNYISLGDYEYLWLVLKQYYDCMSNR